MKKKIIMALAMVCMLTGTAFAGSYWCDEHNTMHDGETAYWCDEHNTMHSSDGSYWCDRHNTIHEGFGCCHR